MSVRPPIDRDLSIVLEEKLDRMLGRLYLLWLAGILIGAVKLKPEKLSVGGIEYTIQNPEVLQGIIFVGCILYYFAIIGRVIVHNFQFVVPARTIARRAIHIALGKKKTLIHRTPKELWAMKRVARTIYVIVMLVTAVVVFLPLIQILVLEQSPLWQGFAAIFGL
jgi:hypothetical protein